MEMVELIREVRAFRSLLSTEKSAPYANLHTVAEYRQSSPTLNKFSQVRRLTLRLFVLFKGVEREERLAFLSFLLDRRIKSSDELRIAELRALEQYAYEGGEHPTERFKDLFSTWERIEWTKRQAKKS